VETSSVQIKLEIVFSYFYYVTFEYAGGAVPESEELTLGSFAEAKQAINDIVSAWRLTSIEADGNPEFLALR